MLNSAARVQELVSGPWGEHPDLSQAVDGRVLECGVRVWGATVKEQVQQTDQGANGLQRTSSRQRLQTPQHEYST